MKHALLIIFLVVAVSYPSTTPSKVRVDYKSKVLFLKSCKEVQRSRLTTGSIRSKIKRVEEFCNKLYLEDINGN